MKLDEIETGLKEVAEMLRQVKHYVTKNNVPLPDGMQPVLALMRHHESLQNLLEHNWKQIRCPEMVNLPTNVEQARAMAMVGTQWLLDNVPSELTHPWQMYLVSKKQNDEMTSLLADINEYCQANGIGTIGDSASKALMTHHQALMGQVEQLEICLKDRKAVCHQAFDANDALKAERDALTAQVEAFGTLIHEAINGESAEPIATDGQITGYAVSYEWLEKVGAAIELSSQQHLLERDAQKGRDGFVAGCEFVKDRPFGFSDSEGADQYADSIRRAVGKGTPLGGSAVKDPSKCRAESKGECGCAFGQCANGLVF